MERQQTLKRKTKLQQSNENSIDKILNIVETRQELKEEKRKISNKTKIIIFSICLSILIAIITIMIILEKLAIV